MPIPGEVGLAFRVRAPEVYERAQDHVSVLEARAGNAIVALDSGSLTLRGPTGAVIGTYTATIDASGRAAATVPAEDLPATLGLGPGYVEDWDAERDGVTYRPRRDAYLARRALLCPVTSEDVYQDNPQLRTALSSLAVSVDGWRDQVWCDTLARLRAGGQWPDAIVEVSSLARYVRAETLYAVYLNLSVGQQGRYELQVTEWKQIAAARWREVRFSEDRDEDGVVDDAGSLRPPGPMSIARGAAPPYRRGRLGRVLG